MSVFAQQQSRAHSIRLASFARPNRANYQSASIGQPFLVRRQALGNQAMQRLVRSGAIQAKLTVGQSGDQYEQEADRVAERLMCKPQSQLEPVSTAVPDLQKGRDIFESSQGLCKECGGDEGLQRQVDEEEEEEELLQSKELSYRKVKSVSAMEASIQAIRSGGRSLSRSERDYFEPRFCASFKDVRLHTGPLAVETTSSLAAKAFTLGKDIIFGKRENPSGAVAGNRLLAHELTHVLQQNPSSLWNQPSLKALKFRTSEIRRPVTGNSKRIQRHIEPNLFIRGDNYYFPNQGQARIAALAYATKMGPGHTITHDPRPIVGLPHYHVVRPLGRRVSGHFFYGRRPPVKEKTLRRARERSRESLRRTGISAAIGAGVGTVIGAIIGGVGGGAGGTLVAPGVGTVGGAVGGGSLGAAKGAAVGGLVGGAIGAAGQAVWDWLTK